jgi:hypothetical protein
MPAIDPTPIETELATEALCADRDTAEQVRAQYDAEHGLPKHCLCADGSEPPPGVPCTLVHALELTPIGDGRFAHTLPAAALPAPIAAKVQAKTRSQIAALRAEHQPILPDVVPGPIPKGNP